MKRIRGLLVASTLGLVAVDAPLGDSLDPGHQTGRDSVPLTASLDPVEVERDGNGGQASDRNTDDDRPRRKT